MVFVNVVKVFLIVEEYLCDDVVSFGFDFSFGEFYICVYVGCFKVFFWIVGNVDVEVRFCVFFNIGVKVFVFVYFCDLFYKVNGISVAVFFCNEFFIKFLGIVV